MPLRPSQRLQLIQGGANPAPPFLRRRDDYLIARRRRRMESAFNAGCVLAVALLVLILAAHT
jgi:hypothetical protein